VVDACVGELDSVVIRADLGNQFPGLDVVIYNEHFSFGRVQSSGCSTVQPEHAATRAHSARLTPSA